VLRDEVVLSGRRTAVRDVVRHPGAVAVVPVLEDGRIVLLRHWRHPVGKELIEIPAGTLEPGEDPEACAIRELEEETGWIAGEIRRLAAFHTAPGFCDERLTVYLARDLRPGRVHLDPGEELDAWEAEPDEVRGLLADGRIEDAKTLVGLLLALGSTGALDE
jgi:8-oxo-dGTP pyrophosphatase MutT (NUDIX family)